MTSAAYCALGWHWVFGFMRGFEVIDTLHRIVRGPTDFVDSFWEIWKRLEYVNRYFHEHSFNDVLTQHDTSLKIESNILDNRVGNPTNFPNLRNNLA
jgi:hypothetical protein